jgi:integrase
VEKVSEGPVRITKTAIDAAWRRRRPGLRLTVRDAECRGLALVINPTGMAWEVTYKPRGADPVTGKRFPTRYVTLGSPDTHSPDQARAAAGAIKGQAKAGADPAAERRAAIAKAASKRALTVARLLGTYAAALPHRPKMRGTGTPSPRFVAEEMAHARTAVATMKAEDRAPSDLTAADLRALLVAEATRPATARHRFGALSRFLDWCQEEGHILVNPCLTVSKARRPRAIQSRSHYLPMPDLARLWHAAETADGFAPVHRDLIRLLIALPCRRGEATQLDWSHLDLAKGVWTMPGKLTKNRDTHRLPLHSLALDLLRARWEDAGKPKAGLVFPSPKAAKAVDTFSDLKAALEDASGVTGWRWHDFRRSFATALAEAGVAEAVADALLNHRQAATRGGVLGVYQQATRRPEQEAAMRRWDELLTAAIEGRLERAAVVVGMDGRAL